MKSLPMPEFKQFDIDKLTKAKTNTRQDYPEDVLVILTRSIKHIGLLSPPIATPEGEVIDGWARVQACKAAGFSEIPVKVARGWSELDQILASFHSNRHRADLYDDQIRPCLKELRSYGFSPTELAELTGIDLSNLIAYLAFYDVEVPKKAKVKKKKPARKKSKKQKPMPEGQSTLDIRMSMPGAPINDETKVN